MKNSIPMDEQETVINLMAKQIDDMAHVYTTQAHIMGKLSKLHEKYPDVCIIEQDDNYGMTFSVPREWIKISPKRQMSEESKLSAAQRLKEYSKAK